MHCQLGIRLLKDILYFKTQSFCSGFWLIQNPDVSIASKSLPLIQKQKKTSKTIRKEQHSKQLEKENIKALKSENSISNKQFIYVQNKTSKQNSPIPKNFKFHELGMSWISDLNCLTMVQLCSY